MNNYLATGFRAVDETNSTKMQRCLDAMQAMDSFKAYKQRTLDLLVEKGRTAALDVGCGLGDDVIKLSQKFARAAGVDSSTTLINEAQARYENTSCEFFCADAHELPFADAEFDAVRIDRALQHITGPQQVIAEMARVTKRGGIVLCAEPDWGTFFVRAGEDALTEEIQEHWASSFQNPWIGRQLSDIMSVAGIGDLIVEEHQLLTRGFEQSDLVFDISATLQKTEGFEDKEKAEWLETYRASEAVAGVTLCICKGTRG
ncbi:MAG: methyltransferase domain-containing protein [Pseudomonadota bacterium]